jgi:dUTP pyrophosphatase
MSDNTVLVKTLDHWDSSFSLPFYASSGAAGADIRVCSPDRSSIMIAPGQRILIPTGLAFEIPQGFEIQVRPRSGISLKTPLMVVNSPGTIDSDYRGEIKIIIGNFGNEPFKIEHGERIAQIVLCPVWHAQFVLTNNNLSNTDRGSGGFGSTGKN